VSDALIDAAQTVFEQYGARRANVDDVATAAGVSRSTLYRRYPSKEALLEAVLEREIHRFYEELATLMQGLTPQEMAVECIVQGLQIFQRIPILGRLAKTEPEVLASMSDTSSNLLGNGAQFLATALRNAGATMPEPDLLMSSEVILRTAASFLMIPGGTLDLADETAVRKFAWQHLAVFVS